MKFLNFRNKRTPRIAVCFFGITRSLTHTLGSIEANVLSAAREVGTVSVHGHFFRQCSIDNARSGEKGTLDTEEYRLISYDTLTLEQPDLWIDRDWADRLKANGDQWDDGFASFRNLLHQLHSLERVTLAALGTRPDVVAFCRPDLRYHDSFGPAFRRARSARGNVAFIPPWQHWRGGLNDRFAICAGVSAAEAYGCRVHIAQQFVEQTGLPMHSERLLRYALISAGIRVRDLHVRASRVRLGGAQREEDFRVRRIHRFKQRRRFLQELKRGSFSRQ